MVVLYENVHVLPQISHPGKYTLTLVALVLLSFSTAGCVLCVLCCVRSDLKASDAAALWLFTAGYLPQTTPTWPIVFVQKCKVYLSKMENVFVKIASYICINYPIGCSQLATCHKLYLPGKLYLSKMQIVFVQNGKYNCQNCHLYLSKSSDWFFLAHYLPQTTSTWPSCKLYLFSLQIVFVNIVNCTHQNYK